MEYVLRLGEGVVVRRGWIARWRIFYAGAVSEGVFSLAAEWSQVHNSAAYNVYFSKSQREFALMGGRVTVISVSRHEIRFRYARGAAGG